MNIGLENATIYITIVTFSVWIAKCLIVSPLKESISGLQKAIEKLEKSISILDSKIAQHDARLVRLANDLGLLRRIIAVYQRGGIA